MNLTTAQTEKLLTSIKNSLTLIYTDTNIEETLTRKIKAGVSDLITSGVDDTIIFNTKYEDLVYEAIETYVIDNWTLEAGKRVQSPVYLSQVIKLREIKGDNNVLPSV